MEASFYTKVYETRDEVVNVISEELKSFSSKRLSRTKDDNAEHILNIIQIVRYNLTHLESNSKFMTVVYEKMKEFEDYYKETGNKLFFETLEIFMPLAFKQVSLNTTQPPETPKKLSPPCNVIIGAGSYGTVYEGENNTVIKEVEGNEEDFIEIMFLKSFGNEYSQQFIPKIQNIFIEDKIKIVLNDCGKDLVKICRNTSYTNRIELIPRLLCQMGRILMWTKKHNIAHMDIKTDNFCLDSKQNLYLIDWGFVGPVCKNSSSYVGTHQFADPVYLKKQTRPNISHEYDMFSCGMTIIHFISKNYVDIQKDFTKSLEDDVKISTVWTDISNEIGEDYVTLLKKMIDLDPKTRLTPSELYNYPAFDELRKEYPILEEPERKLFDFDDSIRSGDINEKMVNILIEWIREVAEKYKLEHILNHTTKLIYKITNKINIKRKDYQGYGVACFMISNFIFNSQIEVFEFRDATYVTNNTYTQDQIKKYVVEILELLDWNVYPEYSLPDWNITCDKRWVQMFYVNIDNDRFVSREELDKVTKFILLSDEEKIKQFI